MNRIAKIVYINLDARVDRRSAIEQEFSRVGIVAQRFAALDYNKCPNTGCLLSHATVLEQAYNEGCENVLVLEDDFKFIDDVNKVHTSMCALFDSGLVWDVVMLTTCAAVISEHTNALVSKISSSGNGAGYLVNRSMMLELSMLFKANVENLFITKRHWEYQNDILWKQLMPVSNWYMFNEYLGYQREGYSDLSQDYKIAIIPHDQHDIRSVSPSVHFDQEDNEPIQYTEDSVVNKVISSFIERSNIGYKKYGTTLDRDDLSVLNWIQHAQEEHMDAILYLEKLKTYYANK